MSFIPLIIRTKNLFSSESSLKYFLTQAFASSIFLFSILFYFLILKINEFNLNYSFYFFILISSSLILKCGIAPFHFWFPSVTEGLSWKRIIILITWQKIAPLFIISYCFNFFLLWIIILFSIIFGRLGGLNQTSLRKLIAFSSISHLGWITRGLLFNEILIFLYFLFYCFLRLIVIFIFNKIKIFNINQTFRIFYSSQLIKFILFILLLSLGGLPPFLGFFPKWIIIESIIFINIFFLLIFILFFTLITLYFYMRICYSAFLINHKSINWNFKINKNFNRNLIIFFCSISIFGFCLINIIFILI